MELASSRNATAGFAFSHGGSGRGSCGGAARARAGMHCNAAPLLKANHVLLRQAVPGSARGQTPLRATTGRPNASRRRPASQAVFAFAAPETPFLEQDSSATADLKSLPRTVENAADDPTLANPLQRHQRLSTGWMGVILEFEGILIQSTWPAHMHAWLTVAEEEGKAPPLQWVLKRAEGMKAEQVIQEVFHWTRNPMETRRIAQRKEEIYREAVADCEVSLMPGVMKIVETCTKNDVPVALVSSDPEDRVLATLNAVGMEDCFAAVITAGDCQYSRPDPEPYLYAAQLMGRPPMRCVVVGGSNASIEGAHEAGMQSVVVANLSPMYELTSANLVVKNLSEISFVNLKQLFQLEQLTSWSDESEAEFEMEEEPDSPWSTTTTIDDF